MRDGRQLERPYRANVPARQKIVNLAEGNVMSGIKPEETIERETAWEGKLITVQKETVRLPDGRTTVREIVVHPEVVAILPVTDDGRLVLVRQYRKAAERVLLEFPAGGVDDGETAEEAVRREMIEETGYRVADVERLCGF